MATDIQQDLLAIARQERELIFPTFTPNDAWQLGCILRDLAIARLYSLVIDIRRFGDPAQPLFYTALAGTTPDNPRWVQRKSNVVARFHRSSYAIGLEMQLKSTDFATRYALPEADYAGHGGAFPLHIAGTGIIGSITVSGLPQRDDHELIVEAIALLTGHDYTQLKLPTA